MEITNYAIAILVARIILGVLFFFQGYDKVFKVGMVNVITAFKSELGATRFPDFVIVIAAYFSSFVELIGGLALIIGLFRDYTLYLLGLDLILVAVALGSIEPLWRMDYVFPRLVLLLLLLLLPSAWDCFTVDRLIQMLY